MWFINSICDHCYYLLNPKIKLLLKKIPYQSRNYHIITFKTRNFQVLSDQTIEYTPIYKGKGIQFYVIMKTCTASTCALPLAHPRIVCFLHTSPIRVSTYTNCKIDFKAGTNIHSCIKSLKLVYI
jgi:hypothetical protein